MVSFDPEDGFLGYFSNSGFSIRKCACIGKSTPAFFMIGVEKLFGLEPSKGGSV
jgi:hypothetical protein